MYAIGATRVGGSAEEDAAHALAAGWMREAGLEVEVDAAGNLLGRRGPPAEVWTGSHLDSVPDGGRFDGALGVVAGIEVAARHPGLPLAVVAFRDEERGCAGSRARVAAGDLPAAFLELHVEQGPVLERAGAPLGIVTAIARPGPRRGRPPRPRRPRRDDADGRPRGRARRRGRARAPRRARPRATARSRPSAASRSSRARRTSSRRASTVSIDARAATAAALDALVAEIGFEPSLRQEPVELGGAPLEALRAAAPGAPELVSGAGHDAAVLAAAGVPAGLLFVRSLNGGASHCPDELSTPEDVARGVDALAAALVRIAR